LTAIRAAGYGLGMGSNGGTRCTEVQMYGALVGC
jgi:hypothetical protein